MWLAFLKVHDDERGNFGIICSLSLLAGVSI